MKHTFSTKKASATKKAGKKRQFVVQQPFDLSADTQIMQATWAGWLKPKHEHRASHTGSPGRATALWAGAARGPVGPPAPPPPGPPAAAAAAAAPAAPPTAASGAARTPPAAAAAPARRAGGARGDVRGRGRCCPAQHGKVQFWVWPGWGRGWVIK